MTQNGSKPSLLNVAKHAKVSPATVSRVINGSGPVSKETQVRVMASIAALGYEAPPSRANSSIPQRTIAALITDILNPFFPEIVRGIEDEAESDGYALLLCNTAEDPQREKNRLRMLAERRVDGVVVCASRLDSQDLIALHDRHHIPLVVISRRIRLTENRASAGRVAVEG